MFRSLRALPVAFFMAAAVSVSAAPRDLPDFTAIVEAQGPAVVNIATTRAPASGAPTFPGLDENDPMYEFFRRFMPDMPPPGAGARSLGSGFIVSDDGYILTNAHVIEDADEIIVRLADKGEFTAEVVGTDARTDIAVIRIEAEALPVLDMGDPEELKVGEWVVAIGSPFGFEHSVTAGIVSAKGRSLPDENFVPFLQTDVAINPGNSGGPLFNMAGEVVGINSQIYSQTGGFMGLSFAIPIDVAMSVHDQLRESGHVQRGRIGVAVQEITRGLAEGFGLPSPDGALVSAIDPDGPGVAAGLEVGDVIVEFDGEKIHRSATLPRIVAARQPGNEVDMVVIRGGEEVTLSITLAQWEEDEVRATQPEQPPVEAEPDRLGLVVAPLEEGEAGVRIARATGAAAHAGLRPGDQLLSIAVAGLRTAIDSVERWEEAVAGLEAGQSVTVLVQRNGQASFVSVSVAE